MISTGADRAASGSEPGAKRARQCTPDSASGEPHRRYGRASRRHDAGARRDQRRLSCGNTEKHMSAKRWISFPKSEGEHSRQAHADSAAGTYEREMGKEGFFGPSCQFHHRHPPTGWTDFEGDLRPHAFDLNWLPRRGGRSVGRGALRYTTAIAGALLALLEADGSSGAQLRRRRVAVHPRRRGRFVLRLGPSHLSRRRLYRAAARRAVAHRAAAADADAAHRGDRRLLPVTRKGLLGPQAIFDPAILATPQMDEAFRAQQGDVPTRSSSSAAAKLSTIAYPYNPLDAVGWHGDLVPCASTGATFVRS